VLCYTLLGLFVVSFGVWLIFAWSGYARRYATNAEGWSMGATRSIELTVTREDFDNLGCASDVVLEGLHCQHRANQQPFGSEGSPGGTTDGQILRPYVTVDRVVFLGAGLWSALGPVAALPPGRFSAVCNFHMAAAIKSVSLRWSPRGPFEPAANSVPAGTLTDCRVPP